MRALLALAALACATPALADDVPPDMAEQRLRGCMLAGASAAPATGLADAVIAVRSFCAPQIKRVREYRVATATTGLTGEARKTAEDRAVRALNDEIALAISNFTGLTL